MADEASGPRPPARREADDKEMSVSTSARTKPFRKQGSANRARILCARVAARCRGCVAWRVGCGGEEAGVGHGAGAEVARKEPKQVRARAQAAGA